MTCTPPRERKLRSGRHRLPENLPRVTHIITCDATACTACGEQTTVIGYEEANSSMSNRRTISYG